jgi:hypothetical protein
MRRVNLGWIAVERQRVESTATLPEIDLAREARFTELNHT